MYTWVNLFPGHSVLPFWRNKGIIIRQRITTSITDGAGAGCLSNWSFVDSSCFLQTAAAAAAATYYLLHHRQQQ